MAKAGRLEIDVVAQSAQFVREMRRVNENVAATARSVDRANATMASGFAAAGKAVKAFGIGLAAAVGAGSASGLARLGKQALDSAGNFGELAIQAGVTTTQLQQLQVAGLQVGISQEQLVNSLAQFGRRVGEAAQGTGTLADTMKRYGISATDSAGQVRSSVSVLEDFADVITRAESSQEQLAIVSDAFGSRIGARLLPLLADGSEGFQRWAERASAAGLVMDEAFIQRADQASDAMATLQFAVAKGFEIGVVESFNAEIGATVDNLTTAREAGELLGSSLGTAMSGVVTGFADAVTLVRELNAGVEKLTSGLFDLADVIKLPAKQFEFMLDQLAGLAGATKAPDTSLEALAPPEVVKRIRETSAAFKPLQVDIRKAVEATDDLAKGSKELTGELKRLADAGKILTQTSAQEERFLRSQEEINRKLEERIEIFREMNDEEMRRRVGQREAGGMSAPGLPDDFERQLSDPFKNALEDVQNEFTRTFEEISRGTIGSFEDMADAAHDIFTNLSSNLATLAIFDPRAFQQLAQQHGIDPRLLGGAAAATPLLGLGVGLFGNRGAQQGLGIGGGVGTAAGALIGSLVPGIGTAVGAIGGGLAGSALGGLFGGIFGGDKSRIEARITPGNLLGARGGQNIAAQFIDQVDAALLRILDDRQEALANSFIAAGKYQTNIRDFSSEADKAAVAAARIGPAAQALGFNAAAITKGTSEQQLANLQTAIGLMKQIESFRIGPVATGFRDLNDQFAMMAEEAGRLGVAVEGMAAAHIRAASELNRQFMLERTSVGEMVGHFSPLDAALRTLELNMQAAAARAVELGIPLTNVTAKHHQLAAALVEQFKAAEQAAEPQTQVSRSQRAALAAQVGAFRGLDAQLRSLEAQMQDAAAEAAKLGISTRNVTAEHRRLADELVREHRLQQLSVGEQVGAFGPLDAALRRLEIEMQQAAAAGAYLGISTANVTREHIRLAEALLREHQAAQDALALSITSPFEQLMDPLQEFLGELQVGNLNPAGQIQAAQDEFRRIAELARAGSTTAIQQLESAGQAFIQQAERFGASPGGVAARTEVISVVESVMADVNRAQREASAGLEGAIMQAAQRQVDTLRELIDVGRLQIEEIKRLRR